MARPPRLKAKPTRPPRVAKHCGQVAGRLGELNAGKSFGTIKIALHFWNDSLFHILLRTGPTPLSKVMRRLMTGYAVTFNRRHRRAGHLFQNRYKSVVCEENPYLLELIRYIHLNPLRAKLVEDLKALNKYPWTGHSAILGRRKNPLIPETAANAGHLTLTTSPIIYPFFLILHRQLTNAEA
jgi:hypothetical protein